MTVIREEKTESSAHSGGIKMNALEIVELVKETERLELDITIHKKYRKMASRTESEINEYLIAQAEKKLYELNKLALYER